MNTGKADSCSHNMHRDLLLHGDNLCNTIQQLVQQKCDELSKPWHGEILFPVYPVHSSKDDLPKIMSSPPVEMNICSFGDLFPPPARSLHKMEGSAVVGFYVRNT